MKAIRKLFLIYCLVLLLLLSGCTEHPSQNSVPENSHPDEITDTDSNNSIPPVIENDPQYTHQVYEVTISETLISNNSVGNDWQTLYSHENDVLNNTTQWSVPINSAREITIVAEITEKDKWPDIGTASLSVILSDGFVTSSTIAVTENKGRYKGNVALWEIICKVSVVKNSVKP